MTAMQSPAIDARAALIKRLERGLMAAPAEVVMRRFDLTREELRDLCPDMVDAPAAPDDRSDVSGY